MLISLILILIVTAGGLALTYLIERDEPMLWRVCAGTVIGQAVFGTALFLLSFGLGLSYITIVLSVAIAAAPVLLLIDPTRRKQFDHDLARAKGKLQGATARKILPFIYYFGWFVFFIMFFDRAMIETAEGIFTGGSNNLGDLPFHLGIIYSFSDGANFPPQNPSFAQTKFSYPFIADLIAAAFAKAGSGVREAIFVQNISWAFALLVILERFVYRLINDRLAARIAPFLLVLSGGLGFLWFFSDYAAQSKSFFQLLMDIGKDYTIGTDFRWGNSLITLFMTQRSLLMGMPLTIVVLGGLWRCFATEATESTEKKKRFSWDLLGDSPSVLGFIAGMLALVHLHSLFVLFVVTALLLLMRPARWPQFVTFGFGACVIAIPELMWSITGSATHTSEFFGFYFGWESAQSNIVFAWIKNIGIFIPMLLVGLYLYKTRNEPAHDASKTHGKKKKHVHVEMEVASDHKTNLLLFYIPFAFLFVLTNVVKLAPWEWDNIKVLIYWFIGSLPFVTYVIVLVWRQQTFGKIAVAAMIFALTASGGLDVWRTVSRQHFYRVFDPDAIRIAERLRLSTPPDSLFLNAPTYNSAVVLSGRLSLMRYPGHLGSHGIDYGEREKDVKEMYRGGKTATELFAKYGIDYVLVSPEERNTLTPAESYFSRYPVVAEFGQYKVYDVRNKF
jgi:hypothetical protein